MNPAQPDNLIERLRTRAYKTHGGTSLTSKLLTEAADCIADLTKQLTEAVNELHCCDDVPLDGGLAAGIAALRSSRNALVYAVRAARETRT